MRWSVCLLTVTATFALAPATVSAQPLYVPNNGPASFGPGNYSGLAPVSPASNGAFSSGRSSFAPTGGLVLPYGRANFSDSALSRGPNTTPDPHFYGGYYNGQIWVHRTYQSPAELMTSPRNSTRAPFQYLPGPTRP